MADFPQYPATSFDQAVDLTIFTSNQLGDIINGDGTTNVQTETGPVPTVRKALVDNFYFKNPIPWVQGQSATVFNQLYYFFASNVHNGWYYAPGATSTNPILMGNTPEGDANWRLYSTISQNVPAEVFPWGTTITSTTASVSPPFEFDTAIVTFNGVTLTDRDYSIANNTITFTVPLEPDDDQSVEDYLYCYLGRVQEGGSGTNYITYTALATTGATPGASLVGTTSGNTVQEELNKNSINVYVKADYHAKGDGITDDTSAIQMAAQYAVDNNKNLVFENGTYLFDTIRVSASIPKKVSTEWIAEGIVNLISTKSTPDASNYDADYAIRFTGVFVTQVTLDEDAVRNAGVITLSDVSNVEVGDLVGLQSSRLIQTDHRGQAREGQLCKVTSVNSTTKRVGLQNTLRYMAPSASNQSGTVTSAVSGAEFTTSGLTLTRRNSNVRIRFNSGANSGQIRYVTKTLGNTLYIGGDQIAFPNIPSAGDTFSLEWMTDVTIVKPIKVKMSGNFNISRAVTTNASAGDVGFRGLDIIYSDGAIIDGITVEGFSETGIRLRGSFQPTLLNATVRDANRGYNTFDGTGYGVSINQCFGALIDNIKTYRCRKGIDVIGTQMISWETMVKGCTASGGGVDYRGTAFWPNGPTENSGMGSHGAGYSSEYHDCLVVDCHLPYAVRGLRESFIDCRVHGYVANACLRVAHGGALTVDGLTYDDTFTEIGQTVSTSYSEDSRPGSRATGMVELFCGLNDGYLRTYPITIKNCNAKKVTLSFLLATGAGDTLTLENVSMGNNTIYVSSENTTTTEFSFVRTEGQKVIKNIQDLGGNRFILDGGIENQWCLYDLRTLIIPEGSYVRLGENSFFCTLADDQALRIPISTKSKTAVVTLFDHEAQRNYRAHNMQLEVGVATDRSPLQATNKVGVNVTNTTLTGTTGTDGTFTVAFLPSGGTGYLYLENRMGAVMRPCVIIHTVPF